MTDRHRQVKYEQLPDRRQTSRPTGTAGERALAKREGYTNRSRNRNRNRAATKRIDPADADRSQRAKSEAEQKTQKKKQKKIIVCATMKDAACSHRAKVERKRARAPGMSETAKGPRNGLSGNCGKGSAGR